MKRMKTYTARPADVHRRWLLVDAEGRTLGRLATQVATVLKGKHKAIYTPHLDTGEGAIVLSRDRGDSWERLPGIHVRSAWTLWAAPDQ